ncbi:DUF1642 domain-containing protein [Latilactobacillus sakei]|uniref:DUF1642 domain-containing protein n=1 Tax=Latilactobacillus sakei TaxID=1599 RepID=UPI001BD32F64|nr:DUF1642 domain-containing protein [Latilactobacillus sakei]QVQ48517.1 DUF1642 domain-containing protein [Latilactobacillus sakei subsp. sakei]
MNYETKRNVFEGVVETLNVMDGAPDDYCKELIDNYDEALPDNLPVIPEAVGEWIKDAKGRYYEMLEAMTKWTLDQPVFDWIHDNSDTFALAWLDGVWCIEETGEIVKLEDEK